MRMNRMRTAFILIGIVVLGGAVALAQAGDQTEGQSSAQAHRKAVSQPQRLTDIGIGFYKTFTSSTSGNGTAQTPSNSAGGMLEVRHIVNPLVGYEFTYSFNPSNQAFAPITGDCRSDCNQQPVKISDKGSLVALDWVVSHKEGSFRPFAVGGLGFFINSAGYAPDGTNTIVRPTFVFGGGVDWQMRPHFGLRFQYRDNYYKAPDIALNYASTGGYTQTAEPMAGFYYRY